MKTPSRWPSMKSGARTRASERLDRRVVALDVPDREHARRGARASSTSAVGFGHGRGDRLLDEDVEAPLRGRTAPSSPWELVGVATTTASARVGDLLGPRQHPQAALARDLLGAALVVVVDAHERDARQPRRHAGVVAPEVADADDGEAHRRGPLTGGAPHLMKPRSLVWMNRTSSSTSGWPGELLGDPLERLARVELRLDAGTGRPSGAPRRARRRSRCASGRSC